MPSTPPTEPPPKNASVRIIGNGRAGGSFATALEGIGVAVDGPLTRHHSVSGAAEGVDAVLIAVRDNAITNVARAISPGPAPLLHISGATPLHVLAPHQQVGSLHPLMALPNPDKGAKLLTSGISFAVAGHPIAGEIAGWLGGTVVEVPDSCRAAYHAAASIAANHAVALWAQVERIAEAAGLPAQMYWPLMRQAVSSAARTTAAEAITGPAVRGDWDTIRKHLQTVSPDEVPLYLTLATEAAKLGGRDLPADLLQ